ncbi:MAG: glycerol-3-phosphate 1-O-acyltransferase PlsY [Armatimonadota bacterium]
MTLIIGFCLLSYLIGSLPFGLWIGLLRGVDIRTLGSKNIGATNVLRVLGPIPGSFAFILDTLKGVAGVTLAMVVWPLVPQLHQTMPGPDSLLMPYKILIGVSAILGHTFSAFLRFKGGKGVATSFGVLLALNYPVAVVGLITWIVMLMLTRTVSIASLTASYSLPFGSYFALMNADRGDRHWMIGLGVLLSVLVTVKHRGNIRRILAGTEPRIGEKVEATAGNSEPQGPVEVR